tara:strand:+ start:20 stop:184 length:165 start_codon:yes stop_codon:yes gene_type:complete
VVEALEDIESLFLILLLAVFLSLHKVIQLQSEAVVIQVLQVMQVVLVEFQLFQQ